MKDKSFEDFMAMRNMKDVSTESQPTESQSNGYVSQLKDIGQGVKTAFRKAKGIHDLLGSEFEESNPFFNFLLQQQLGREEAENIFQRRREKYSPQAIEDLMTAEQEAPQTYLGKSAQRASEIGMLGLPMALATGGTAALPAAAISSGAAGLAGQGVEESGGGFVPQLIAEILASSGVGALESILSKKAAQSLAPELERALDVVGQKKGYGVLVEKPGERALARVAEKGNRTQDALQSAKKLTDDFRDIIKRSPKAQEKVKAQITEPMMVMMEKNISKIRDTKVQDDVREILDRTIVKNDYVAESFMEFDHAINEYFSKSKTPQFLKQFTREAIKLHDDQLGKDFIFSQALTHKYKNIASALKPSQGEDMKLFMELGGLASIIGTWGTPYAAPLMTAELGSVVGRRAAREYLLSPNVEKNFKIFTKAFIDGNLPVAQKVMNKVIKDISKYDKNAAKKLRVNLKDEYEKFEELKEMKKLGY